MINKLKQFLHEKIRPVSDLMTKPRVKGYMRVVHLNVDGTIKSDTGFMRNTITNAGLAEVSGLVGNVGSKTAFTYLAVGTDNTAESAAHTALQAEITTSGLERASATVTQETTTQTDDTLQLFHEWVATGTVTVEEAGAFNAASAGTMLGRKLTATKNIVNGEKLQITYKFIFS